MTPDDAPPAATPRGPESGDAGKPDFAKQGAAKVPGDRLLESLLRDGDRGPATRPVAPARRSEVRNRLGPDPALFEHLDAVAVDARDKGRSVVLVGCRLEASRLAEALACLLRDADTLVETLTVPTIHGLNQALAEAEASGGNPARILVAATRVKDASQGLEIAAPWFAGPDGAGERRAIEQRLENAGQRLVIAVEAEPRLVASRLSRLCPQLYLLPWTSLWLDALTRDNDQVDPSDLFDACGDRLHAATLTGTPADCDRERALFLELDSFAATARSADHRGTVAAIDAAIDEIDRDPGDRRREAVARLEALFDDALPRPSGGEVARLLFTLAVANSGLHHDDVLWLARCLIPEGEAAPGCLPPGLAVQWRRQTEDDVRLRQPRRAPPDWRAVLDHDPDAAIRAAGLVTGGGRIRPGQDFTRIDPLAALVEGHRTFLANLLDRLAGADIYRRCDIGRFPVLIRCHLQLASLLGRLGTNLDEMTEALAMALGGLDPGDRDLPILIGLPPELAAALDARGLPQPRTLSDIADIVEHLVSRAAATEEEAAAAADLVRRLDHEEMRLRRFVAFRVISGIGAVAAAVGDPERALPERIFAVLAARLDWRSVAHLIAFSVLFVPAIPAVALGRATLHLLTRLGPQQRRDRERLLLELLSNTIDDIDLEILENPGAVITRPPVLRWVDGIRLAADAQDRPDFAPAFATVMEDRLTTYNIPWRCGLESERLRAPVHVATSGLAEAAGEDGRPGLLIRIACRDPRAWLADLTAYEEALSTESVRYFQADAHIRMRLQDVFFVLVRHVEAGVEALIDLPSGRSRLEAIVFGTIAAHVGVGSFANATEGGRRIEEAMRRNIPGDDAILDLLRLYPAAVYAEWRFRLFGERPIERTDPDYDAHFDLLKRLRQTLRAAGRTRVVGRAFTALAAASRALADELRHRGFAATAARLSSRAARLDAVAAIIVATAATMPAPRTGPAHSPDRADASATS